LSERIHASYWLESGVDPQQAGDAIAAAHAALAPVPETPLPAMPFFSSGQNRLKAAGVEARREGGVAAAQGVPLAHCAGSYQALKTGLEFWT
jgi:ribulose-bisphosphate carboxylase large chain